MRLYVNNHYSEAEVLCILAVAELTNQKVVPYIVDEEMKKSDEFK